MANQDVKLKNENVELDDRGFIKAGTEAEKRKLKNLQRDITKRDIMFIKSVKNPTDKKNQNFVKQAHISFRVFDKKNDVTADDVLDQMSRMNNMYHNLMLDICDNDYYNNLNPRSIMDVLGPYESVAAMSRDVDLAFSDDSYVKTKLKPEIKKLPWINMDSKCQSLWRQASNLGYNERPGYLSTESAAMVWLAWSKQASDELRKPDCDESAIKKAYDDKVKALADLCDVRNIHWVDVEVAMGHKVSEIINEDAQLIADIKPFLESSCYCGFCDMPADDKRRLRAWQSWSDAIDFLNEKDEKLSAKNKTEQTEKQKKAESETESKTKESEQNDDSQAKQTKTSKKTERVQQNGQNQRGKRVLKTKPVYIVSGSKEEARHLNKLKSDIADADISFMDYNASVNDLSANDYDSQMGRMNRMYYRIMLGQCVRPLMNGINPMSVMQAVGMYVGMTLVNKDFRQSCNTMIQQQLYPIAEKLPIKYQKKMELNHDLPIGLDSAAMMHLSWTKQAYNEMRKPGADINEIMTNYTQATNALQERCIRSGISPNDLNKMVRIKVGQLAQKNPAVLTLFSETSYQQVTMDDFHEETLQIQGEHGVESFINTVWSGEFTDNTGELSPDKKGNPQVGASYEGTFTPRPPCAMNDMIQSYKSMLSGMNDCQTVDELDKFFTQHDIDSDLYETMMISDGYDRNFVVEKMSSVNKAAMNGWMKNHPDEIDNLKKWASEFADKMNTQNSARQKAGVSNRKIPTKFEDILQDSGEYYNYSMDKL